MHATFVHPMLFRPVNWVTVGQAGRASEFIGQAFEIAMGMKKLCEKKIGAC